MPNILSSFLKKLRQKVKTKSFFSYNRKLLVILPLIIIAVLGIFSLLIKQNLASGNHENKPNLAARFPSQKTDKNNKLLLANFDNNLDLPIGSVKKYEVPNAQGVAVLIPQIHRNPGSEVDDPSNDSAQITQEQIYKIIKLLNERYDLNLIAVEGELQGRVEESKINPVAKKIQIKNSLTKDLQSLKKAMDDEGTDANIQEGALKELSGFIKKLERDIELQGAPYKLKAEGVSLDIYGTEVEATRNEGTVIARNYIYINDRISSLNGSQPVARANSSQPAQLFDKNLVKILMNLKSKGTNSSGYLANLKSRASLENNNKTLAVLDSINSNIRELKLMESPGKTLTSAPSREDNPYKGIQNKNVLEEELKKTEAQIQNVIIDKRNIESVQGFKRALKSENTNIGLIQFGAGHEEGMVKEFNKEGISVIVITPQEVLDRQKAEEVKLN